MIVAELLDREYLNSYVAFGRNFVNFRTNSYPSKSYLAGAVVLFFTREPHGRGKDVSLAKSVTELEWLFCYSVVARLHRIQEYCQYTIPKSLKIITSYEYILR